MSLYNFNEILKIAQERDFKAIGSFNLHCIEMLPAFFKAAQNSRSPLMIQISTGTAEYLGYRLLVDAVRSLADSENIPTCLHLDHCSDIKAIETAMNAGFSSVMYDGSHLSLEENIGNTRIVVEMARPRNITVEGELGAIGGSEDGKAVAAEDICFTTVEDATRFVKETQVDMLAVSVGTVHGLYTGKAQIQHARLKAISEATGVPLVLHGGTGVSDEDMRLAVTEGINKVNVGTEMNVQWVDRCKSTFEKGKVNDSVRKFLIPANQAVTAVLMEKWRYLNSVFTDTYLLLPCLPPGRELAMFESLKTLWKKEQNPLQDYDQQSRQLAEEIARLEGELQRQPDNSDVQKTLMLTYNRALSVYAKSKSHRQDIDALFLQIDNLRNIIRRNI